MQLIYCASGNRRFAEIAMTAGFKLGTQVPGTVYYPPYFCDQDWKRPNRVGYMAALAQHKPTMATVLDWEREDQLSEVLAWAEEAAQHTERVLIVPKVQGGIDRLPRQINGRDIVLAFSVPTRFGGTELPLWDFAGWPVHLLGGSPHTQMRYYHHLMSIADVVSADGNMINKMATQRAQFWCPGTARYAKDHYWPRLVEAGWTGHDAPLEAFRRSCENIVAAWSSIL